MWLESSTEVPRDAAPEQFESLRRELEARLAACVQIQPITSHYWWDGKITSDVAGAVVGQQPGLVLDMDLVAA